MKTIILAAGQGTRLRPLTDHQPKCMVEYQNKTIIDWIIASQKACGIDDIAIVTGYKESVLKQHLKDQDIRFFRNAQFEQTNMVATLFNAQDFMDDDLIISYADIIYHNDVLQQLIDMPADFAVTVDKDWQKLWSLRMDNPLSDAETLKIKQGKIIELGKKPNSLRDIEGQYIGLIKISKNILPKIIATYHGLNKNCLYDGKDFDNIYMTSFIQWIIDHVADIDVEPAFINGGWLEIDTLDDLKQYQQHKIIIQ